MRRPSRSILAGFCSLSFAVALLMASVVASAEAQKRKAAPKDTIEDGFDLATEPAMQKTVNIRVQYLPLLVFNLVQDSGVAAVETMFSLAPNVVIGPVAGYYRLSSDAGRHKTSAGLFGGRVDLSVGHSGNFFTQDLRHKTSLYLSNVIMGGSFSDTQKYSTITPAGCDGSRIAKGTALVTALTGGYQYFAEGGFNFNLGLGYIASRTFGSKVTKTGNCNVPEDAFDTFNSVWLDFGGGYAF